MDSQPWMRTAPNLVFLDANEELESSYGHLKRRKVPASSPQNAHPIPRSDPDGIPPANGNAANPRRMLERAASTGHMDAVLPHNLHRHRSTESSDQAYYSPAHSWHCSPPAFSPGNRPTTASTDLPSAADLLADYMSFDSHLEVLEATTSQQNDYPDPSQTAISSTSVYLDTPVFPLSSKEEAALLRYYVKRLSRDFDLSDPLRHFRLIVPQRAATCPLLLNAIYALAARHLSRVGNYDPLISNRYHQECLKRVIPVLDDSAAILDENLLASTIILRHLEEIEVPVSGYSPSDSQSHLLGSHAFIKAQRHAAGSEGLRKAAFWVGLRQEIYVAFVNQRPIAIDLEDSSIHSSTEPAEDHIWSCRMVALCAEVIDYCFGEDDQSTSAYSRLSDCVDNWHACKSPSFSPMFFREPDADSVFPECWFLSDEIIIGWQHYYVAKLLLCAHSPKVPRLGPARTMALQAIDEELKHYVRLLCGIALSNPDLAPNFTYASMSIVAAGDKFTEQGEREALLHVLGLCDTQYAFPTGHARENLRAAWGWAPEGEV